MQLSARLLAAALFFSPMALTACGDDNVANTGNEVVEACSDIECPIGTTRYQDSSAQGQCSGSGSVDIFTESGEVKAQCTGSGECLIICIPPEPCCEGEKWTSDSYECEKICAATCTCDGKCGTVTGSDCEADCGGCDGGLVCSADNLCVDSCAGGVIECGGECCGTGESCHELACCDPIENCKNKSCGTDGCGGQCETLDSIDGCALDETCNQEGKCEASCAGKLPECSGEVVLECQKDANDVYAWVEIDDCAGDGEYCVPAGNGATCAECGNDAHCDDGNPCTEGEACADGNTCLAGSPKDCDDGNPCNGEESCDADVPEGCVDGTPLACDDENLCNGVEICDPEVDGGCVLGEAPNLDDGVECTTDACDPSSGVTHEPDDAACNDGNECTDGTCDAVDDCLYENNTVDCEDDLTCTVQDVCAAGVCSGIQTSYKKIIEAPYGYGGPSPVVAGTSDGGVLFLHAYGDDLLVHATRYDALGEEIGTCPVSLSDVSISWVGDLQQSADGAAHIVVGKLISGDSFVAVLGDNCAIESSWTTVDPISLTSLAVAPDGSMAVVGYESAWGSVGGKDGLFMKMNSDLEITKTTSMGNQRLNRVRYLPVDTPDGGGEGFIAVGQGDWGFTPCDNNEEEDPGVVPDCLGGDNASRAVISRWTVTGTPADSGFMGHEEAGEAPAGTTRAYDVIPTLEGDGGYILVGSSLAAGAMDTQSIFAWMGRTDAYLSGLEWSVLKGDEILGSVFHNFIGINENPVGNGYITVGSQTFSSEFGYEDVWIAQINSSGILLSEVVMGTGGVESSTDVAFLDTGIAIGASITDTLSYETIAAWLVRTDATGGSCSEP